MLVLLSFALVLLATVLLVLGLLNDDGLTLIYISIASSVAAAVVLLVALRVNKPPAEARRTGPEPLPEPALEPVAVGASSATTTDRTAVADAPSIEDEPSEWLAADQDTWASGASATEPAPAAALDDEEGEEVEFPIADYDTLTVGQILPLLPQLYTDEIDVVEERERSTKARPQVLAKLAELRGEGVLDDPLASYTEPVASAPGWDDEEWFPIEDYESLSAAQIQPLLPELDAEELALVRARELSLGRRRSLLDEIDRLMGNAKEAQPATARAAAAAPSRSSVSQEAKKAPAKKGATKKAAAKKKAAAPAKKAAATKKAAPASKAATPAKKSATKATTPAKQAAAPAKKTATKAVAPAKKTATKAVAPAKKTATKAAAPAKKTATKKAAPAKKSSKTTR